MSKNNNVNPAHYKDAGRERQGEQVNAPAEKAAMRQAEVEQAQPRPPRSQDESDERDTRDEDRS